MALWKLHGDGSLKLGEVVVSAPTSKLEAEDLAGLYEDVTDDDDH